MKRRVLTALVIAVLLGAAGVIYATRGGDKGAEAGPVKTAKAQKGDLRLEVIARGTVTPDVEVIVKGKAGGEILSFPFEEGDSVDKGRVVIKLDPRTERARANQVEASLLITRAKLEKARVSRKDAEIRLERQKRLFSDGIVSRQELDDSEIAFEKSKSDVKLAEAEELQAREVLNEANERLADTEIKAPLSGTILKKFVDEGHVISSTLSSASEGTELFSMANLDYIFVSAQVDEVDISRIATGQEALAIVDSLPDRVFAGQVQRIAPKGKVERTVTVFDVVIRITDPSRAVLKPGMTANVRILTELKKGVLLVPNEAIKLKDKSTGVYRVDAGARSWVAVKPGKTDGILTEVVDGLGEGAEVVTSAVENNMDKPRKRGLLF